MGTVKVNARNAGQTFKPFERLTGSASWTLEKAPKKVSINLIWHTSGRGTEDVQVVASEIVEQPGATGSRDYAFDLPAEPYSFSGNLITLAWAIEAIAEPGGEADRFEFVMSPTGAELRLNAQSDEEDDEDDGFDDEEDDADEEKFKTDLDRFKK